MERQNSFLEVGHTEKQMLSLIYSKGILDDDVLELYRQTRTKYEKLLLSNNHMVEPQEVEFHLWKLHYALIDEFRKKIKKQSWNAENNKKDKELDVFKTFLSEASEFYKKLIVKLRKLCGLPSEIFLNKKGHSLFNVDSTKLHACEKTCHRLLVCLGDLARYTEIMKKPESCEWSTAAMYYLEAARTWPDSGNPHNQLALLATYVGDPFLALYHCVRSLAVREPFPDAWRNIMLLFEENRSTKLAPISSQTQFDFSNPSRRSNLQNTYNQEDLWGVLVRTISILLTRSSLDEFSCTFASFLHCLEAFLASNDTEIADSLQSYQRMDSSRKGPYRAIQLVSVFIFIVHSLTETPEREELKAKDDQVQTAALALAAILTCMGRLSERCMTGNNPTHCCPLMPAVLAFSEWLVGALDTVRSYDADERVRNALSYYTGALSELADRIRNHQNVEITAVTDNTALWEDHELRGFYPLHQVVHETLNFTTNQEYMHDYCNGMQCRLDRMFFAATRITETSKPEETKPNSSPKLDEEEVILFKPITRRNSAPLYISKSTEDQMPLELAAQMQTDHDWLRRATSLSSTSQSTEDSDSFTFTTSFKQKEVKDPTTAPTGPPSLSGWVLSSKGSSNELTKPKLSPIDEIAATSFSDLSISETKNSDVATGHISTVVHSSVPSTPAPSAPLLPDDPVWLRRYYPMGHDADGILGAPPPLGTYTSWYPPPPPLPNFGMMSSSEWLYHYRNGHNMPHVNTHSNNNHNNPSAFGNYDLCDQWGNHFISNPMMYLGSSEQVYANSGLVYGAEEQKRDKYFLGYQRAFPYVCGVGMDLASEQPPLLHHLKEKERQLQPGPQLRGPPFI